MNFRKWLAVGLGIVALFGAAVPSYASGRDLAVLVVGRASDPAMTAHERAIIDQLTRLRVQRGWNHKLLPIYSYHLDKAAEKSYCEDRLKVKSSDLIVVGLVELDSGVPVDFVYRENEVSGAEPVADKVIDRAKAELAARGRLASTTTPDSSPPPDKPAAPTVTKPTPSHVPVMTAPAAAPVVKPAATPKAASDTTSTTTKATVTAKPSPKAIVSKPAPAKSAAVAKPVAKPAAAKPAAAKPAAAKPAPAKPAVATRPAAKPVPAKRVAARPAPAKPAPAKPVAVKPAPRSVAVATAPSKPVVKPVAVSPQAPTSPTPIVVKPASSQQPVAMQPAAAGTGNEHWAIQVALFSSLDKARAMVAKLKEQNLQGVIRKGLKDGVLVYRVVVGEYSSQAESFAQAKTLQESGVQGFSVNVATIGQVVK